MKVSPARLAALETVTRVRERSAYAHETLDAVLRQARLDPRDAALATRLAYGTIAARGTLDDAVRRYLAADVKLEPRVADALAVGAYEVLFARTPSHAAVNQTVELVRSVRKPAAGLANAVMRKLAGEAVAFPWGDPETETAALARMFAHPVWLTEMWVEELGRDAASAVMAADNEPAPLFLAHLGDVPAYDRVTSSLEEQGAQPETCPLPRCILAKDAMRARLSSPVRDREVLVMDAGAQLAVHALRPGSGGTFVEIGAGRGSKSLLLATMARDSGCESQVTAIDVHAFKLEKLEEAAAQAGVSTISTVVADVADPSADLGVREGGADGVLVDAPCSGLGTLRRHPDRRWKARPEEMEALGALGERLLEAAARLVRPGGFVVYSTCTIARRENQEVVEAFLATDTGRSFSVDSLSDDVPAEWERFVLPEGWFRSLPEPGGPDGHFIARLVRAR